MGMNMKLVLGRFSPLWTAFKAKVGKGSAFAGEHPSWTLILIVLLMVFAKVLVDVQHPMAVLQPIAVPEELEDMGVPSETLTSEVQNAISKMDSEVSSGGGRRSTNFRSSDEKDPPDFEIPGTKLGYRQIIHIFQDVIGKPPTRISAEIIEKHKLFSVIVHVSDPPVAPTQERIDNLNDPASLSTVIAEHVLSAMKPAKFAGYLYYNRHREAEARQILDQCILRAVPEKRADCYVLRADVDSDVDFNKARTEYYQALRWNPHCADALTGLGWLRYQEGNSEEARQFYKTAIETDGSAASPHHSLASMAWDAGDMVTAREEAEKAVRISDNDPSERLLLAAVLSQSGEADKAVQTIRGVLAENPTSIAALDMFGNVLFDQNFYEQGEEEYAAAIKIDPAEADIYYDWGLALLNFYRYEESAEKFRHALALHPDRPWYHVSLGKTLGLMGNAPEAEKELKHALDHQRDSIYALSEFARLRMMQGRLSEAEQLWNRALQLSPANPQVLSAWGDSLRDMGNVEEAASKYREALHADSRNAHTHSSLANQLVSLGQLQNADREFERAVELAPGQPQIMADWGTALFNYGYIDQAAAIWAKIPPQAYNSPFFLLQAANSFWTQNGFDEAACWMRQASKLNPGDPVNYLRLGEINIDMEMVGYGSSPKLVYLAESCIDRNSEQGSEIAGESSSNWQVALNAFAEALRLAPGNATALSDWGRALALTGRQDEAEKKWQEAVTAEPGADFAYKVWGNTLLDLAARENVSPEQQRNLASQAEDKFRAAINRNSGDADSWYGLARSLVMEQRWEEADKAFARAISQNPGHFGTLVEWGYQLALHSRQQEARQMWRQALEMYPHSYYVHYRWADAMKELKQYGEAAAEYKRALFLSPDNPDVLGKMEDANKLASAR
jgi:tetratricopeptide (TPR) repeat protein